jgi:hypothetical protein
MIKMSYSDYRFPPEIIYRVGLVWRTYGEAHLSHDAVQAANPAHRASHVDSSLQL